MSPSKCKCFSPSRNLASCSLLTFYLYFFNSFFCGDVIYGTFAICFATYTIVGIIDGATLPLIIFLCPHLCAFLYFLNSWTWSCSFLSSILPLTSTSWKFCYSLISISNVVFVSFLVIFTLGGGFYGFSFWWTNRY